MKRIIYDYEKPHIVGRAKNFPFVKAIVWVLILGLAAILIYIFFFKQVWSTVEANEVYAVFAKADDQAQVTELAEQIRQKGGGGFVDGSKIYVAVYLNKEDALAVASRYDYQVEGLGEYKIKINFDSAEFNKKVVELCNFPNELLNDIYDVSLALDSGELSEAAAVYAIENAKNSIVEKKAELEKLKELFRADKLLLKIESCYDSINSALIKQSDYSVSSTLKYRLIELAFIYKNLLISIS